METPAFILLRRFSRLVAAACALLLAGVVFTGWWTYMGRPQACLSCHVMRPYYDSWADSSHFPKATCVSCHAGPGFGSKLAFKLRYSAEMLGVAEHDKRKRLLGGGIRDGSCARCHDVDALIEHRVPLDAAARTGKLQQVRLGRLFFRHATHLGQAKRGIEVRCATCHNQMVQGSHAAVDWQACILCHFKGGGGTPITGCGVCHTAPMGLISHQGREFAHAAYTQQGMSCEICHTGMVKGQGKVETARCRRCHPPHVSLDRIRDIDLIHRQHVSESSVDCRACHEPIEHHVEALSPVLGLPARYQVQQAVYMGSTGKGLGNQPDVMFRARVTCQACHPAVGNAIGPARLGRCVTCHGPGYDRLAKRWQGAVRQASAALAPALQQVDEAVRKAAPGSRRSSATALLRSARDNLQLVQRDGSGGVHNMDYTYALLGKADEMLQMASATLGAGGLRERRVPANGPDGFCRRCHFATPVATPARRAAFANFSHDRHLGRDLQCDQCHRSSPGPHGPLRLTSQGCNECHHARARKRPGACGTCHPGEVTMLAGKGVAGVAPAGHRMAERVCVDCHGAELSADRQAVRTTCIRCHRPSYGALMDTWQASTAAELKQVRALVGARLDPRAAEARRYLAMVEADRSHGVHNFVYARRILDQARRLLQPGEVPPS